MKGHFRVRYRAMIVLMMTVLCFSLSIAGAHEEPILLDDPITVTGTVTDDGNVPLAGATVLEKGTSNGTITDANGAYSLRVDDAATLVISYIGYTSAEVGVAGRSQVNIQMTQDIAALSEVIVVGYGRQQKRDVTGSIASISSERIRDLPLTNFENAIHGQLAGVQVLETSGEPGAGPDIRVRGLGSISAGNEPLYVIDGFPVSKNVGIGAQGDLFRRRDAFRPPTQKSIEYAQSKRH